jgi:hypothetical protein
MKNCIALSWNEAEFEHKASSAVRAKMLQYLENRLHLQNDWRQAPDPALLKSVVQAIAIPGIIFQLGQTAPHLREWAHVLNDLTEEERQTSYDKLGLNPAKHRHMLALVPDPMEVARMVSYIAASFLFTTTAMPLIYDMPDLVKVIFSSNLEDSEEFEKVKNSGLLVVKYPLGTFAGIEKASGALFTTLCHRAERSLPTVFVDLLPAPLARKVEDGQAIMREELESFVLKTGTGLTRLGDLLQGPSCKVLVIRPKAEER